MVNFETWYTDLISDTRWLELLRHYKDETIKKTGERVYALLVADKAEDVRPMSENRKHVYNMLCKNPGDRPKGKPWYEVELEKKIQEDVAKEEWKPASDEHVAKCVAEFHAMLEGSPMMTAFPRLGPKEAAEKGGWVAPKWPARKMTTAMEAYNKERKIAYYRYCFDPITRDKLPTYVEEDVYNAEFDRIMVKKKKHPNWELLREIDTKDESI